jgi:hypothetical protein
MASNRTSVPETIGGLAGSISGAIQGAYAIVTHQVSPPEERKDKEEHHEDVRFERSDANIKGLLITGAALVAGLWISAGLLYFYFAFLNHYRTAVSPPPLPSAIHGHPLPPEPRLQQSPSLDMQGLLERENFQLSHYAWVDKAKGTVAIPLDRAIRIVAERGIPPQKTPPDLVLSKPQAGTRATGFEGKVEPEPR